jgi:mannose-1-phosphate guanylyltransferase
MVPVLNTPFLEHVIRYLAVHNVKDIVLAQGHLPRPMEEYFRDGSRFGTKLTYALETRPMNTAGAVKNAEQFLSGRFYVMNGDIFTDLDMTDMLRFHLERKAKVTIALTPVENPTAYGLIETTPEGRVTRFLEKPTWDQVTTNMINAGTYILEPEILRDIPAQTNYSFERQLFPALLARGEAVYAYPSSCYWIDIGTPEKYLQVHQDLLNGKSRGYETAAGQAVRLGAQCRIDPTVQMQGPVLVGDNCTISRGVKITGPAVIGAGSTIMEEAVIEASVIWHNTRIGPKAILQNTLVANDCHLEAESCIEKAVIGDHITVTSRSRYGAGSRIWPPAK